jgi:hypothetical protein
MARFHLNAEGEPKPCTAKVQCPLGGGEADHYPSKDEARKAFELKESAKTKVGEGSRAERTAMKKLPLALEAFKRGDITWQKFSAVIVRAYGLKRLRELGFTGDSVDISANNFGSLPLVRVKDGMLGVDVQGSDTSPSSRVHIYGIGSPEVEVYSKNGILTQIYSRNFKLSDGTEINQYKLSPTAPLQFERIDPRADVDKAVYHYRDIIATNSTVIFTENIYGSEDITVNWCFDKDGNIKNSEVVEGDPNNVRPPSSALIQAVFEMSKRGEPLGVREVLEKTSNSRKLAGELSEELANLRMNQDKALKGVEELLG